MDNKPVITRFAPSPTGRLHLGHVYSAMVARQIADAGDGQMLLRIEDIDHTRCRDEFYDGIYEDLAFMGIDYDGDVVIQSKRMDVYQTYLDQLKARDLVYPCYLSRRELDHLLSAPHDTPLAQDKKNGASPVNTDRLISKDDADERAGQGQEPAWRLRMEAIKPLVHKLYCYEVGEDPILIDLDQLGDVVIARKDIGTSYHLSVVIDDAESGVTLVTRGKDLKNQVPIHRLLQYLLDLPDICWSHHPLVTDQRGKRLAKRDDATSIEELRRQGHNRQDILTMLDAYTQNTSPVLDMLAMMQR